MKEIVDLTGQHFGRWTVIERAENRTTKSGTRVMWRCLCECGKESVVSTWNLKRGKSISCGCFHREVSSDIMREVGTTHGGSKTRLFRIWTGIKTRCFNENDPAYKRYGGRGITMCDEWKNDFAKFRDWALSNGYTDELTCDRIDNDKGYSPDNCRWVTMKIQRRNTRRNRFLTINGETLTVSDWAERNGLDKDLILGRLKQGWTTEEAVSVKPNERESKPGKYHVEYNGETHTLAEWAIIQGIPRRTIYERIYLCGWEVERALTQPVDKRKGVRKKVVL